MGSIVVPARAGVIPVMVKLMDISGSCSRASGGDPIVYLPVSVFLQLFPRERG